MAIRSIGATHPVLPARAPRDARDNDERDPATEFETELQQRRRDGEDDDSAGRDGRALAPSSTDEAADEASDAQRSGAGEEPGHLDEYA
jgi:hypothetical protein